MPQKLSGIYRQDVLDHLNPLMRGFDDSFKSPHSRYTEVTKESLEGLAQLDILAAGKEVGLSILATKDLREVYSFGHLEYDRDTLEKEYQRDLKAGKHPQVPKHYFPDNDPTKRPQMCWNLPAATFFSNWINYAVYQETPYRLEELNDDYTYYACL